MSKATVTITIEQDIDNPVQVDYSQVVKAADDLAARFGLKVNVTCHLPAGEGSIRMERASLSPEGFAAVGDYDGKSEYDGWIKWHGGDYAPINHGDVVDVITRGTGMKTNCSAMAFPDMWRNYGTPTDIVAYRIVKPHK